MVLRAWPLIVAAVLAACSSQQARIRRYQAAYDASPPAVQRKIQQGEVDVGFTSQQVIMALGDADRVYTRKSAGAREQQVWAYGFARAGVGFGFGVFSGGPVSTGVSVDTRADPYGEARTRVVFEDNVVVTVEQNR